MLRTPDKCLYVRRRLRRVSRWKNHVRSKLQLETEVKKPITRMNPSTLSNSQEIGYSQISIVEPGRMAYVSGQVAASVGRASVPKDLVEQTKIIAANLKAALHSLGATTDDIAVMRIFVVDLNDVTLGQAFPVLLEMLDGAQPSITGIGVAALAGSGLKVEVEMTVRIPD